MLLIVGSYFGFGGGDPLSLIASLVGVTALIFCAKGNPAGQFIMLFFCGLYGIISYQCAYYGEMITYLGMSAPMALISFLSWIRNPYSKGKAEVRIDRLYPWERWLLPFVTAAVTVSFYFILKAFGTANLLTSTLSVATSFFAAYLIFRRSSFFALAYVANDLVLIVLWSLAAANDSTYGSVIACFAAFLFNDLYSFWNWMRMRKKQETK